MKSPLKVAFAFCCSIGLVACSGKSPLAGASPAAISAMVTLSPSAPSQVDQGESITLTAGVQNDPSSSGVTWALACTSGNCGGLSGQTSSSVTYTAPANVSANASATVTATSIA